VTDPETFAPGFCSRQVGATYWQTISRSHVSSTEFISSSVTHVSWQDIHSCGQFGSRTNIMSFPDILTPSNVEWRSKTRHPNYWVSTVHQLSALFMNYLMLLHLLLLFFESKTKTFRCNSHPLHLLFNLNACPAGVPARKTTFECVTTSMLQSMWQVCAIFLNLCHFTMNDRMISWQDICVFVSFYNLWWCDKCA